MPARVMKATENGNGREGHMYGNPTGDVTIGMPSTTVGAAGVLTGALALPVDGDVMPKVPLTIKEMLGLFAISFSYGFVFNSLNSIVIPIQIQQLALPYNSLMLGLVMAVGAFCQLSAPIMGAWSDRTGRRLPFLVYGSLLTIVGLVMFVGIIGSGSIVLLMVAHMFATVGLSVQYAIMTSLLSDCVAEDQVGTGSGVIAMLAMLGSGFGYGMFACKMSLAASYFGYMLAIVMCLGLSIVFLPKGLDKFLGEASKKCKKDAGKRYTGGMFYDLITGLSPPSPSKYPDFTWACVSRSLFNAGLSGQVYLMYYFRDVVHVADPAQTMAWVAVMALLGGILGAVPSGVISDKVGKKPVVYIAILVTVVCLASFMLAESFPHFLTIGLLFGFGNVAYLSVDYAIGVQVLPRSEDVDSPPSTPHRHSSRSNVLVQGGGPQNTGNGAGGGNGGTTTHGTGTHTHGGISGVSLPPTGRESGVARSPSAAMTANMPSALTPASINTHLANHPGRKPGTTDAAKDLGLFAMAATLGQLVGQLIYGAILHMFRRDGRVAEDGTMEVAYDQGGYILVYSIGGLMFLLSGLATRLIINVS